ncbi:MAG: CCXG family PEP-CTERM protein [Pseudomonadota bacterium]|nr:CCXG family PEP-CTERM protein [Pseudomonadota bacterium]
MFRALLCALVLMLAGQSFAALDTSWPYKTTVTLTSSDGSSYVLLTFTAADLYADYSWSDSGDDLRVLDSDDSTELGFHIKSWDSSAQTASVWVYLPDLSAGTAYTLYLYYGNESAAAVTQIDAPDEMESGILFHSRYNTSDPASKAQAISYFEASDDSTAGYGSALLDDFVSQSNESVITDGASTNFILYSSSIFSVSTAGTWYFRAGVDFGLGGGLYIDDIALDEQWDDDMWWNSDWTDDSQILAGSYSLSAGEHTLLLLGAEDSNGGIMTLEFSRDGSTWYSYSTDYLDIESYPVYDGGDDGPDVSYGSAENTELSEGVDIVLDISPAESAVEAGSADSVTLTLTVSNYGEDSATVVSCQSGGSGPSGPGGGNQSSCNYRISVTMDYVDGLTFATLSGTDWSCQVANNRQSVTCTYQQSSTTTLDSAGSLPELSVDVSVDDAQSGDEYTIAADVVYTAENNFGGNNNNNGESDSDNNSATALIYVVDYILAASGTSCSGQGSLSGGALFAAFYDTSSSWTAFINSASDYESFIDTVAVSANLYGQTLVSSTDAATNIAINNPFQDFDSDDYKTYFYAALSGYLYIPSDGLYRLGIDGDDDIEVWLDDSDEPLLYMYGNNKGGSNDGEPYSASDVDGQTITDNSSVITWLERGYHPLAFHHYQRLQDSARFFYIAEGSDGSWGSISSARLYQCDGYSDLQLTSVPAVQSDPVNDSENPKNIPGAIVDMAVTAQNNGSLSSDYSSSLTAANTAVVQALDGHSELYVGGLADDGGPVTFSDGSGDSASGLSYSFSSLAATDDSLEFDCNDSGTYDCDETTMDIGSDGYAANITAFRILFTGSLKPRSGDLTPQFEYRYRVRVN